MIPLSLNFLHVGVIESLFFILFKEKGGTVHINEHFNKKIM